MCGYFYRPNAADRSVARNPLFVGGALSAGAVVAEVAEVARTLLGGWVLGGGELFCGGSVAEVARTLLAAFSVD